MNASSGFTFGRRVFAARYPVRAFACMIVFQWANILSLTGFAASKAPSERDIEKERCTMPAASLTPNSNCFPDSFCPDWAERYDGAGGYDRGIGLVTSSDGSRIYVTGVSTGSSTGVDFATLAYEASTGKQLWVARYNGPSNGNDTPFGFGVGGKLIAISKDDSRIFVTGSTADSNGKNSYVTIAYDATDGTPLWVSLYSTPQDSEASSLALSADGKRLYVTGFSALANAAPPAPAAANYDFGTVAYDAATGAQLWEARYEGPAGFWDIPYAMAVANVRQADGSRREQLFVTGRSNGASAGNSDADFATVAYDGLSGSQLWVTRYNGDGNDRDLAYALATSPDGSLVFVTGESAGAGGAADYATLCYDAVTGTQRWVARYDNGDLDEPLYLSVSPTGDRVAVTGFSVNPVEGIGFTPLRDAATIVYDAATGVQIWLARHSEIDGAAASRVAFSRDGARLYVSGLENGNVAGVGVGGTGVQEGHSPALAIAYDATTGTEIWATHYSGPAGDEGNFDLFISPDDAHIFVTGGGQSSAADIATLSFTTGAPTPPPVQLDSVVSRKTHGNAGTFDIILDCPPCAGLAPPGVECRSGGANGDYTIVFSFRNNLTSVGSASVTSGTGSVSSSAIDSDDTHNYIVNLTGVADAQVVTVSLANVYDSAGNGSSAVSEAISVLIGDTNADSFVNSADISQTKSQSGNSVSASNFREDVNADGFLNSADISLVKSRSGTALP
jgi:PQQ-like domain/Dockerin type I domain